MSLGVVTAAVEPHYLGLGQVSDITMTNSDSMISVGMPVFNGEQFVEASIRSILDQTYPHFELIISDNASTDRTPEICQDYAVRDKRVVYTKNSRNIGAAGNYNRLFELSTGEFFRWANADDISGPELHAKCLSVLQQNSDAVLAYGKNRFIDSEGKVTEGREDNLDLQQASPSERFVKFYESVGFTNVIYGLMRRDAVARTALMGDGSFPSADINFMAELTLYGKFVEIADYLFFRRWHAGASSWEPVADDEEVQQQFWNAGEAEFTIPTWKQRFADFRSIRSSALNWRQRWALYTFVSRQMYWQKGQLVSELTQAARK